MTIEKTTLAITLSSVALGLSILTIAINTCKTKGSVINVMQQPMMPMMGHHNRPNDMDRNEHRMHKGFNKPNPEKLFNLIDINKDGNISKEEWLNASKDFKNHMKKPEHMENIDKR
jgi:hypothetical protein